jgi:predicted acylesterase/phospholipase RssA
MKRMRRSAFLSSAAAATATLAFQSDAKAQFPGAEQRAGRTALVLSGGGSRGAYQAGVIFALAAKLGLTDGQPLPYDLVCGTSIGALNAYLIATAQYGKLRDVWWNLSNYNVATIKSPYYRIGQPWIGVLTRLWAGIKLGTGVTTDLRGLLDSHGIHVLLESFANPSDSVHLPLYVAATNLTRARGEIFVRRATTPAGTVKQRANDAILVDYKRTPVRVMTDANLRKALFASAAIPVAFDPVMIEPDDGGTLEAYVDGGVTHNVPIGLARRCCENLQVVLVDPAAETLELPAGDVIEIALGVFETMQRSLLEYQVRLAYAESAIMSSVGHALNDPAALRDDLPLKIDFIRPAVTLPGNTVKFDDADAIHRGWDIGYADGTRGWQAFIPSGLTA